MTLRSPAWPRPLQTLWLAWRRRDLNPITASCVIVGWLLLAVFGATPAHTLVVRLLPTALAALQYLLAALAVELVAAAGLLALVATRRWWQPAALTTTRSQLAAGFRLFGWLVPGLLLARLGMVIIRLASVIEHRTPREEHPLAILAAVVAIAVVEMALTAIAEELLFRGLVFNALLAAWGTTRRGIYLAALTTSAVWGAVHLLNPGAISQLLLNASFIASMGLILAALRLRTGSIWAGVAFHWVNNVAGVLAVMGSVSGWWIKTPAMTSSWMQLGMSVLVALGGLWLIEFHCRSLEDQPCRDQQATADVPAT